MSESLLERLWAAQLERLRTARGIATTCITAIFIIAQASSPSGDVVGLIIISPLIWWIAWWVLGFLSLFWKGLVRGNTPAVKVGRAWSTSGSARRQLREDNNAHFFSDRGGILLRRRYWFVASGTPVFEISEEAWRVIHEDQSIDPQYVVSYEGRHYWMYEGAIYWTNADYRPDDIKALLFARQRRDERQLEHAHNVLAASALPAGQKREPIPQDVKHAVFQRDEGKCVECGSNFNIQYDHVIPVALGGATTVENLQVLCATCNQSKGARL